jgi:tetratricopeptide (TPR) repeat protein
VSASLPTAGSTIEDVVYRLRRDSDDLLKDLTRLSRARPADMWVSQALGRAHEDRADLEDRQWAPQRDGPPEEARFHLQAAAGIYEQAGRLARLRMHKGTFYFLASQVYGRMRDTEAQFGALRRAVQAAPYAGPAWNELTRVSLAVGRWEQSREARRSLAEWAFPGLQPKGS